MIFFPSLYFFSITAEGQQPEISSRTVAEEIQLTCKSGRWEKIDGGEILELQYKDKYSGKYTCTSTADVDKKVEVLVKFRSKFYRSTLRKSWSSILQ